MKNDTYSPVDLDFIKMIKENRSEGKIHYFGPKNTIEDAKGLFDYQKTPEGEFLSNSQTSIRLDKIITFLGKPGPSYEQYERYSNACLTCEDLGQF